MIEFMQSIYEWFVSNQTGITTSLCSGSTAMLIASIIMNIKQRKTISVNTESVNTAITGFNKNKEIGNKVELLSDETKKSTETVENCRNEVLDVHKELTEFKVAMESKIDTILEVQSIVYSTLKNDTMRESVEALLSKAKASGAHVKEELERELAELQHKFDDVVAAASTVVTETIDKAKNTAGITNSENLTRY